MTISPLESALKCRETKAKARQAQTNGCTAEKLRKTNTQATAMSVPSCGIFVNWLFGAWDNKVADVIPVRCSTAKTRLHTQSIFFTPFMLVAVVVTAVFLKHVKRHFKGMNVVVTDVCHC